jgi:anti-sigma B factor antagonist
LHVAGRDSATPRGGDVLDLTAVTFLDSAGLTALLQATLHAEDQHRSLRRSTRTAP